MRIAAHSPRELLAARAVLLALAALAAFSLWGMKPGVVDHADGRAGGHRARGTRGGARGRR